MSNNKQSSIEWLVEKMLTQDWYTYKSLEYIKQAKAMHKEEIINAIDFGNYKGYEEHKRTCLYNEDEQYYNERFIKE